MKALIGDICSLLREGAVLVLATILSQEGSTPRTAGAKMVIREGRDN